MKVTVLVENTAEEPLQAEHGLSFLIEYKGEQYLLDAGSTDLFLENAEKMNASIWDVKKCFLSHGHYDHSGGFTTYLSKNKDASLYMMKDAAADYYSGSGELHAIGIPKEVIELHQGRFHYVEDIMEICEGVYVVPHTTNGLEKIGEKAKLYRLEDGELLSDNFSHEMSLVFDTEKGLVVFNSCSHGGVNNIMNEVLSVFPQKKVFAFLGGLHMKGKKDGKEISTFSEEEIKDLSLQLRKNGVEYIYTGHCTGKPAMKMLEKYLGEHLMEMKTGLLVEL